MYQPKCKNAAGIRIGMLVFSALLVSMLSFGQKIDFSKLEAMKPRSIGPANMSGRITAIDVVRNSPEIIYAGSASGGLWKSESGGVAWEPIFDGNLALSIGAVKISQKNPDVVWVGTGEGNPRNSLTGGYGIYRSLDAGKTWKLMGLEKTRNIHRILIDPNDPNTVYVGAIGSPWGEHKERGVYKTTDGGETWNHILYVDEKTGVGEMVMDPSNPNKILVNMWQHRREPWFFTSGGPSSGLYMTLDGGKSWTKQSAKENGIPEGDLGRMGLAFATNNPNRVYALIEAKENALYRSDDGGFKWEMINKNNDIGNRPFYYFEIYVDPTNENRVYSIFTNLHRSEDGGKSFENIIARNLIHVDNHALYIHPDDPKYVVLGNDGGLAITRDMGKTWQFIENLPLGQYYHINVDNELPYNVYGGLQDNGTWTGPAYTWTSGGLRNDYNFSIGGGDGFDVMADPDDSRYGYSQSQQGNVSRYDKITGSSKRIKPTSDDPKVKLRFNWNSAMAQDPFDNSTIYFGSQFVHKSTNKGNSWTIISPDLTTNDTTKQNQDKSGGLTIDATGAENHTTLLVIEPSSLEKGVIWAGSDDGLVHVTRDGGATWANVSKNIKGVPEGSWVNQIKASRYNKGEAVAVINNYRRFDFKPYLMRTKDYGKTWTSMASENDVFGYALSFIQDPVEPKLMFFGTEHGLYVSIDEAKTWTKFENGYPSVSTMDLVIQERESDLVIGTFGRSIYVLDDIRPLRVLAKRGQKSVIESAVTAIDASTSYMVSTRSPSGPANPGSATYEGENRSSGSAVIKFFAKKPETPAGGRGAGAAAAAQARPTGGQDGRGGRGGAGGANIPRGPQAKVEIFDLSGTLVRTLSAPINEGLNSVSWRYDEDPPEETVQPELPAGVPAEFASFFRRGGAPALPGAYTFKVTIGDQSDEGKIEFQMDPRDTYSMNALIARRDLLREVNVLTTDVSALAARITKDSESVDKVLAALNGKRGPEVNALKAKSEEVKKQMKELSDAVGSGGGFRFGGGSDSDVVPLNSKVSGLSRTISGSFEAPGAADRKDLNDFKNEYNTLKSKVDAWFAANWSAYLAAVKTVDFSPIGG
ncbi:VPS10 domain-containing protein [Roseivirga echinicomitans]